MVGRRREHRGEHLGPETRAAHAEQESVAEPFGPHLGRELPGSPSRARWRSTMSSQPSQRSRRRRSTASASRAHSRRLLPPVSTPPARRGRSARDRRAAGAPRSRHYKKGAARKRAETDTMSAFPGSQACRPSPPRPPSTSRSRPSSRHPGRRATSRGARSTRWSRSTTPPAKAANCSKPRLGRDPVNQPMINNWVEAIGDKNPIYFGRERGPCGRSSRRGGAAGDDPGVDDVGAGWCSCSDDDPLTRIIELFDEAGEHNQRGRHQLRADLSPVSASR